MIGRSVVSMFIVTLMAASGAVGSARAAEDAEWRPVELGLGRAGQMQPGGVYRVALPRTDLKVTVQGVEVKSGFALGSYAAFKSMGRNAMVMGDLVLLDEEVGEVMIRLLHAGIAVTALHNHLNEMSPHVMYMHYLGRGSAAQLATALRDALSASGRGPSASPRTGWSCCRRWA
jgi:hypothetical protein